MSAALEIVAWMCFHLFYTFSYCFLGIFKDKKDHSLKAKVDIWLK